MELFRSVAVLFLGPLIYFGVGLPWAAASRRIEWASLWGAGVMGLTAELAYMGRMDVSLTLLAVSVLHAGFGAFLVLRTPGLTFEVRASLANCVQLYGLALIPLVAAPFAIPGAWGGDWLVALESGRHIINEAPFTLELLARPPLFGAAAIPLLLLGPTMWGFQVFCAVASGCALAVFQSGLKSNLNFRLIWILAGSVFFLQITANAWPKFLSAAFLFAAWQTLESKDVRRLGVAGAMLGFAIATHQSALLFVPLLLTLTLVANHPWSRRLGESFAILIVAAILIVPWELHTVLTYGLEAKLHANPAMSQRLVAVPAWLNALLVGATTFIAWAPLEIFWHWARATDRFSAVRMGHEIYWLVTDIFNSLAGSLLGLVLPWWIALGFGGFLRRLKKLWRGMSWPVRAALAMALMGQMLLNPFYASGGCLQTGWVPIGMALALWFAGELTSAPAGLTRVILNRIAWFGAGPWLVFNFALTAALVWSPRFQAVFFDSDLQLLEKNGWVSLGMSGFPWLQILLVAGFFLVWQAKGFRSGALVGSATSS